LQVRSRFKWNGWKESQDEKYDLHKCVTDDGIAIVVNPEEKWMQILQFVANLTLIQMKLMKMNFNVQKNDLHKRITDDGITSVSNAQK
jgi:hypothetical protein